MNADYKIRLGLDSSGVKRGADTAVKDIARIQSSTLNFVKGFAGIGSAAVLASRVTGAMFEAIANSTGLLNGAARENLSPSRFQELQFAANRLGISLKEVQEQLRTDPAAAAKISNLIEQYRNFGGIAADTAEQLSEVDLKLALIKENAKSLTAKGTVWGIETTGEALEKNPATKAGGAGASLGHRLLMRLLGSGGVRELQAKLNDRLNDPEVIERRAEKIRLAKKSGAIAEAKEHFRQYWETRAQEEKKAAYESERDGLLAKKESIAAAAARQSSSIPQVDGFRRMGLYVSTGGRSGEDIKQFALSMRNADAKVAADSARSLREIERHLARIEAAYQNDL